jgi:hypothetical protein
MYLCPDDMSDKKVSHPDDTNDVRMHIQTRYLARMCTYPLGLTMFTN